MLKCSHLNKEAKKMIVYDKLGDYLKANNMKWIDLQNAIGISPSVMAKFQKNRGLNTETLNKVC